MHASVPGLLTALTAAGAWGTPQLTNWCWNMQLLHPGVAAKHCCMTRIIARQEHMAKMSLASVQEGQAS